MKLICKKRLNRKPIIQLSKTGLREAVRLASQDAARQELRRQIESQLVGTAFEGYEPEFDSQELLTIVPMIDRPWPDLSTEEVDVRWAI